MAFVHPLDFKHGFLPDLSDKVWPVVFMLSAAVVHVAWVALRTDIIYVEPDRTATTTTNRHVMPGFQPVPILSASEARLPVVEFLDVCIAFALNTLQQRADWLYRTLPCLILPALNLGHIYGLPPFGIHRHNDTAFIAAPA